MTDYTTVPLTVSKGEAADAATATVRGLTVSESTDGITLRTREGVRVAVLSDGDSEESGSALRYRASPSLAVRGDATRKSRRVREALAEYEV